MLERARVAAGKVACLAAWIQRQPGDATIEKLRFKPEHVHDLQEQRIHEPWGPLHRLRGANPEAFHYWCQAQHILKKN